MPQMSMHAKSKRREEETQLYVCVIAAPGIQLVKSCFIPSYHFHLSLVKVFYCK